MLKNILKRICQCLGIASLILVGDYGELLNGGADARMHAPYSLAPICFAHIIDIFLVALLLFGLFTLAARTRVYPWVRLIAAIVIPPYLLDRTQSFFPFDLMDGTVLIVLVAWTALLLLLMLRFRKWYQRLLEFGSVTAAALSLFAIGSIAQLLWVASWKPAPNRIVASWENTAQPPRNHPLVVWIVFDELSYDQVFEHRARDLELPNFDALRAESTVFTDTQPAGYQTVKVIPSLLTGHIVDGVRYTFRNHLLVHHQEDDKWHPIDGAQTVFADADHAGWRTAAVGWYNPYCGIYGDAIQNCYWTNRDMFDGPTAQSSSLAGNIYTPLAQVVRELKSPARADRDQCTFDVRHRLRTETDLQQQAFQVLHTDQADFIFFHFAIPHSPNIWSRIDDNYTQSCDSSYLDNLALTDRVLGKVMTTLKASPRWNDTSVIVQGDHGWRYNVWYGLSAWTDEDDAASRGVFDPRPALLIHQAGQSQPQTIAKPWPIIQIHAVVEDILHGQAPDF